MRATSSWQAAQPVVVHRSAQQAAASALDNKPWPASLLMLPQRRKTQHTC